MLKVKSCCCGCSLRGGSVVIMMISIPLQTAIFFGIFVGTMSVFEDSPSEDSDDDSDDFIDELVEAALFSAYATVTGFYGVIKKKPKKVVNYLMIQMVHIFFIAGVTIWLVVAPLKILSCLNLDEWCQIPLIVTFALLFGLLSYLFVVVFSYYRELKNPYRNDILSPADVPLRVI